jgi:hypothetical protein
MTTMVIFLIDSGIIPLNKEIAPMIVALVHVFLILFLFMIMGVSAILAYEYYKRIKNK